MFHAHGKVILLGEHAVVHGRPAIAVAIERGVHANACAAGHDELRITPWGTIVTPDDGTPLGEAFAALLTLHAARATKVSIHATVDLPPGGGLGCSAALGVAVVRALDAHFGTTRSDDEVADASLGWERVFHGNPSGIDSAIAACGGMLLFRRGEGSEPFTAAVPLHLVIADTAERTPTKEMVALVTSQLERAPQRVTKVFDAIAALVQNARLAITAGDLRALGQLVTLNQALLSSILVSTTRIEDLCEAARRSGALGAKLTGGGGGGCVVALAESTDAAVAIAAAMTEAGGLNVFTTQNSDHGVAS